MQLLLDVDFKPDTQQVPDLTRALSALTTPKRTLYDLLFLPESVLLPSSALEVKLGGSQGEKLGSSRQRPGGKSPGSEGEGFGHSGGREIITKEVLY